MESGTQINVEDLSHNDLDLTMPIIDEFIKLSEPLIEENDPESEKFFGDKDNSGLYQSLMKNCKVFVKYRMFFERSIFISSSNLQIFKKAIDEYLEFVQKFDGKKVTQTSREKFQIIVANLIEIFKHVNPEDIKVAIMACLSKTSNELSAIRENFTDLINSNSEFAMAYDNLETCHQDVLGSCQSINKLLTLENITDIYTKLQQSIQFNEAVGKIVKELGEKYENKYVECCMKSQIAIIDFKTILLGHTLYENCSIILETLNTEPVHISTRSVHPNGNYVPENETSEDESVAPKDEEYSGQESVAKTEEDDEEIDEEDEGEDDDEDEISEEDLNDDEKKSSKSKRAEMLQNLLAPLLSLDCASESPVLAAFWVSKLSEMTHPSNAVIVQSIQSVFNEMQHFFDRLDMAFTSSNFLVNLQELDILMSEFRSLQNVKYFADDDHCITNLSQFVRDCYLIKSPMTKINCIIKSLETGRKIVKENLQNHSKIFDRAFSLFKELFDIIIPVSQMARAVDGLNKYASEYDVKVDILKLNFPLISNYEVGPYIRSNIHVHEVNCNYAEFISNLANKIEEAGIQIINKKNEKFSVDKLIFPSIFEFMNETADFINDTFKDGTTRFNAFAKDMKEKMVDGSQLINIIKELKQFIIMKKSEINPKKEEIQNKENIDEIFNDENTKKECGNLEKIYQKLIDLNYLHQLFYCLDLGNLITYSNALQLTYMRFFAHFVSNEEIFEGHSLLEPAGCNLLIDVQRLMQNKLQSGMVQQRISLLNTMKMSLGSILGAAFLKDDDSEYNNLVQWIDIVSQLCRMTDVDGVQQIKPMCINLPRLTEFPKLADDLWQLVEAPVLCEKENRAIEHMQMICQAEFNEDVTSTYSNLGHYRILAMTRDYTSLLIKVKDYGFVSIDDDYELGHYGDSYANRFIEHHWRINICQIDDIAKEIKRNLPGFNDETEPLHSLFSLLTSGGLSLDSVISFGKTALNLRKYFKNREEFTDVYKKLHTFISFLEHHDTLALLIGEISDSQLVQLSLCRTFNYLRFIKYVTTLALKLSSSGAFTNDANSNLFSQCLSIRNFASSIKPTMKLTLEAIEKLSHCVSTIENIFISNGVNYDILFGKCKLFVKTANLKKSEEIYKLISKLENNLSSYSSKEVNSVYHEFHKLILENEKEYSKEIENVLRIILAISRLKAVIDPANQFLENDGMSHFEFTKDDIDAFTETSRYLGNKVSHAFAIPRPKLTVPSTTLPKHDQNLITGIFEEMQNERKSLFENALEYHNLVKNREIQRKELQELQESRKNLIDEFNGLKDGLSSAIEQEFNSNEGSDKVKDQNNRISYKRSYEEYKRLLSFVEITDDRLSHENDYLMKECENSNIIPIDVSAIPRPISSPLDRDENRSDDSSSYSQIAHYEDLDEGIDPQLLNVLKKIGMVNE